MTCIKHSSLLPVGSGSPQLSSNALPIYDRLCRAYGPERVAETVAAVKQQEQAEKEQKRSQKRRHDREAR